MLHDLEAHDEFVARHIGPSADEMAKMLAALGVGSVRELIDQVVPASIRLDEPLALGAALSETEALARIASIASMNAGRTSLIGMGYYGTITPGVILRNILENPAWYTAYTPYQPEISQGRLEALLNFQTMVCELTGMEVANSSLLDEGTAAAEAMTMCRRLSKTAGMRFVVDQGAHPQTIAVLATRAEPIGISIDVVDLNEPSTLDLTNTFGLLVQHPSTTGRVGDISELLDTARAAGVMSVVATDPLALVLLAPPTGADIVVGSAQRFGVPMGFGGPHAGFLATRSSAARALPGRLVGVSADSKGRRALRLSLQTREQHIRREKATSNICTAQVLLAVMAGMYACYHGPDGLARIAERAHRLATIAAAGLTSGGYELAHESFFDTITVRVPSGAAAVIAAAASAGFDVRSIDDHTVGVSFDETSSRATVDAVWAAFGVVADVHALDATVATPLTESLRRQGPALRHGVFSSYRSEHDMLRYIRRLSDRDLALDRTMIPLGSCTMKLNATSEMIPVTWPQLSGLHPFAPADETIGSVQIVRDVEAWMAEVTGYDAVSLQPNAGSQGEFAGLLAIRGYHRSRGDLDRTVCLIPSSAHGTNAASAVMAGMDVVVVSCDERGNVDMADLRSKAEAAGATLAACMVTYPSTHGVFEEGIVDLCATIHEFGGQVYVDGANLNALVGVAKPGWFGADVSHLNLHKTFCIPHGGGGPGVGPVAVRSHLAPFLPNHPLRADAGPATGPGPVSAAPFGSAGILPIPWMYVTMMGADGLRQATEAAIVNANYVATRLQPHFPVLYTGQSGRVAHECIVDLRPLTKLTGVTADDVTKRLIDHGFHAPTVSFPVTGTLMIEPTESESLAELDRFCDAMIAIRAEIADVETGATAMDDSPLRHAPHTASDVTSDDWNRGYSRHVASYPTERVKAEKYWPPVSRIDAVAGDRNLVCTCPPLDSYQ
jgi:glycine dehydrogenase